MPGTTSWRRTRTDDCVQRRPGAREHEKAPTFDAERALWKSHVENTERSYRVMCEAHAQLVEREREQVRREAELRMALLTIFHDTKDQMARLVAATALAIKMPVPFPKKPRPAAPKRSKT